MGKPHCHKQGVELCAENSVLLTIMPQIKDLQSRHQIEARTFGQLVAANIQLMNELKMTRSLEILQRIL